MSLADALCSVFELTTGAFTWRRWLSQHCDSPTLARYQSRALRDKVSQFIFADYTGGKLSLMP